MKHKKSEFWTFCFSCIPGAGQMFLGFAKEGVSLMIVFFFLFSLGSWCNLDAVIFLAPVVWFYAFFDAMNKNSLPDEQFEQLEDHFLFVDGTDDFKGFPFKKYRKVIAVVIIILGLNLLMHNVLSILETAGFVVSYELYQIFFNFVPQVVIGLLIIGAGLYLIIGKKHTLEQNWTEIKEDDDDTDEHEGGAF